MSGETSHVILVEKDSIEVCINKLISIALAASTNKRFEAFYLYSTNNGNPLPVTSIEREAMFAKGATTSAEEIIKDKTIAAYVRKIQSGMIINWGIAVRINGNADAISVISSTAFNRVVCHYRFSNTASECADRGIVYLNNIEKEFKVILPESVVRQEEERNPITSEILTALTGRLSESGATLVEQVNKSVASMTAGQERAAAQLLADGVRLRQEFNDERKKLEQEIEGKKSQLETDRAAFETEVAKWNDKQSTVVRRDLLEKIEGRLNQKSEFKLSARTESMRSWVFWACISMISVSLIISAIFGYKVFTDQQVEWHHSIPFATATAVFFSTIVYYLKWQNGWVRRHAEMEVRNQLLHHDMLRASWFAELMLEYKDATGKVDQLPESVIATMTKNLFEDQTIGDEVEHPVDGLSKFVARLSRINVSEKGVDVQAGPKKKLK